MTESIQSPITSTKEASGSGHATERLKEQGRTFREDVRELGPIAREAASDTNPMTSRFRTLLFLTPVLFFAPACEDDLEDEVEDAADEVDDTVDDVEDGLEDAADEMSK